MKKPEKVLHFADRAEWRTWLEEHHADEKEAWLVHYKKGAKKSTLTYEEAVEEALCFGWIDGLLRSIDAERFALRYSPRKRKSVWAESNKKRAEKLIREGRMTQAGLDKIAEAKESGEWEAASRREDVSVIPPDLEQALQSHRNARAGFMGLPPSRKKQLIWWITSAKRDETRKKRIQATVDMVAD
jgi:uncharacterized protein YdeI (YjbR/CyaY-like superfamily)